MPTDLLTTDTSFPKFKSNENLKTRVDDLQNYLFMLLEQLRYTLGNLDMRNFNQDALDKFSDTITEPILIKLEGTEGELTALGISVGEIAAQLNNAEGDITQLSLTVNGLTTRVQDAEGNISQLSQTVNGFALQVTNGDTTSTISLTSGGAIISSQVINMQGLVTFTSLSQPGATIIDGGNIKTGTISAINLSGNTITGGTITGSKYQSVGGYTDGIEFYSGIVNPASQIGGFHYDPGQANLFLYTTNAWKLKLKSSGGLSIESGESIYMDAVGYITIDTPDEITLRHSTAGNYIKITGNGVDLRGNVFLNGKPLQ